MYRKKKKLPTKLDLSGFKNRPKDTSLVGVRKVQAEVVEDEPRGLSQDVFLFNGKKYNAWQVLGIPAGAGSSEIKAAYANKAKQDDKNKDFYFKAMKTLV